MGTRDPRVDAYIAKSSEFARPILTHLRELVHAALPVVEEDIKWGAPHFMHHGMLAGMAAFKQHCTFGFWKGALVTGAPDARDAMGSIGRITSVRDLPPKATLRAWVKRAAALNESGEKLARPRKHPKKPAPEPPPWFLAALAKNRRARAGYETSSPSHQREYVEWLVEAKSEPTRAKRLATTLAQLAEGKSLHWKYQSARVAKKAAPASKKIAATRARR